MIPVSQEDNPELLNLELEQLLDVGMKQLKGWH